MMAKMFLINTIENRKHNEISQNAHTTRWDQELNTSKCHLTKHEHFINYILLLPGGGTPIYEFL